MTRKSALNNNCSEEVVGSTVQHPPSTLKDQAKLIAKNLKQHRKKCADPEEKVSNSDALSVKLSFSFLRLIQFMSNQESISMEEIVMIMQIMAGHLVDDTEHLFEALFIEHMKIVLVSCWIVPEIWIHWKTKIVFSNFAQELLRDTEMDYTKEIRSFTELMCELVLEAGLSRTFQKHLLKMWLRCLEQIPSAQKYRIITRIDRDLA